jgi:hypothetical protein
VRHDAHGGSTRWGSSQSRTGSGQALIRGQGLLAGPAEDRQGLGPLACGGRLVVPLERLLVAVDPLDHHDVLGCAADVGCGVL